MDKLFEFRAAQAKPKLTKFSTGGNGNNDDLPSMIIIICNFPDSLKETLNKPAITSSATAMANERIENDENWKKKIADGNRTEGEYTFHFYDGEEKFSLK